MIGECLEFQKLTDYLNQRTTRSANEILDPLLLFFAPKGRHMAKKLESAFQNDTVIKAIKQRIPDTLILKNDPTYLQGVPDLTVIHGSRCAMLEVKRDAKASRRPNQEYYIQYIRERGGFASFIHPGNLDEVLDDMSAFLLKE